MKKALIIANMLFASASVFGMENSFNAAATQKLATALHSNDIGQVVQSLDEGADINARLANGLTPLIEAVSEDNYDLASILVGIGADVNLQDQYGSTPLTVSISRHSLTMEGTTSSHEKDAASISRQKQILDMLLQSENIDLERFGLWEMSPLGVAIAVDKEEIFQSNASSSQFTITEKLLKAGANVNGVTDQSNQDRPLMRAVEYRDKSLIDLLLKYGAEVSLKNKYGDTAVSMASRDGGVDIVKLFWDIKPFEVIGLLNARKDKNIAAFNRQLAAFQRRITSIDDQNNNGYTCLMSVLEEHQPEVAKYLIQTGADVNIQNKSGRTALMFAARAGYKDIVELLLSKGARVDLIDNQGQSAVMFAEEKGYDDIVEILRKSGN